jgi:uncharacterized damage-inducible protein DinB
MNAAQFFDHWYRVWRDLLVAVDSLGDEHLDFRPAQSYSRNLGDILRHIINLENGWIHYVIRRKLSAWPGDEAGNLTTVMAIKDEMQRVHSETMEYLASISVDEFTRIVQVPDGGTPKLQWILWHVLEQQIHHRGELFLCMSMLDLPRPKMDRPE